MTVGELVALSREVLRLRNALTKKEFAYPVSERLEGTHRIEHKKPRFDVRAGRLFGIVPLLAARSVFDRQQPSAFSLGLSVVVGRCPLDPVGVSPSNTKGRGT